MTRPDDLVHPLMNRLELVSGGITKRELFALVMAHANMVSTAQIFGKTLTNISDQKIGEAVARGAVKDADTLIAALNREAGSEV